MALLLAKCTLSQTIIVFVYNPYPPPLHTQILHSLSVGYCPTEGSSYSVLEPKPSAIMQHPSGF